MSLSFSIDIDFRDLVGALDYGSKTAVQVARRAMNRTLVSMRSEALKRLREKINIKESILRKKHTWLEKAKGGKLESMEGAVCFSTMAVPLLEFVRGSKNVIEQKGIPVKRRRKLRIEIEKGKRFIVKRAFIQRVHSRQVFKGRRGEGLKKQGIRSVGFLVSERGIGNKLVLFGEERFKKEFAHELDAKIKGYVNNIKGR